MKIQYQQITIGLIREIIRNTVSSHHNGKKFYSAEKFTSISFVTILLQHARESSSFYLLENINYWTDSEKYDSWYV